MEKNYAQELKYINWEKGVQQYGDPDIYKMMIQKFETMTLEVRPKEMVENLKIRNWAVVQTATHTIKGSSGYIAAEKLQLSCKTMQEFIKYKNENHEEFSNEDIEKIYIYAIDVVLQLINVKKEIAWILDRQPNLDDYNRYDKEVRQCQAEFYLEIQNTNRNISQSIKPNQITTSVMMNKTTTQQQQANKNNIEQSLTKPLPQPQTAPVPPSQNQTQNQPQTKLEGDEQKNNSCCCIIF